jgi:uncharacterized protein YndB with AHSA1/START domain/ketosteroid isomerase-like protein
MRAQSETLPGSDLAENPDSYRSYDPPPPRYPHHAGKTLSAFLEADALAKWMPPAGFTAKMHHLDAKVGGTFRMSFTNIGTGSRGLDWPKFDYGSQSLSRRRRRPIAEARRGGDTESRRVESWLGFCLRASVLPRFRDESFCSCLVGLGRGPISYSFGGTYLELVPHERLRYTDKFDDPNFPGEIMVTVTLNRVLGGTEVHIEQAGVPAVIPPRDVLSRLARFAHPTGPARRARDPKLIRPTTNSLKPTSVPPKAIRITAGIDVVLTLAYFINPPKTNRMKPDFDSALQAHFAAIANRDIAAFKSHLSLGDTLYTVVQNGHAFTTPAKSVAIHEQWFKDPNWTWKGSLVHKVVGEDMAMALVRYTYQPNKKAAPVETWLTYVFQVQEGSWRIVHDQNTALDYHAFARAAGLEK